MKGFDMAKIAASDVNLADQAAFETGLSEHAVSGPAGENAKAYGALHGADGAIHPAEFPKQKADGKQRLVVRHMLQYKTPQLQSELTGRYLCRSSKITPGGTA